VKNSFMATSPDYSNNKVLNEMRKIRPFSDREIKHQLAGFTLIEVMVVVAIMAILAAIALPAYDNYIKRSRAQSASADLVSLGLNFENTFQRKLAYPASTAATTAEVKALMPGWAVSQDAFFAYSVNSAAGSYTLTATGTGSMSGCTLSLNNANNRSISGGSACGGLSTW